MKVGKVKFFNHSKGFGFITEDVSGTDYFIHISHLTNNLQLRDGDSVSFDVQTTERGLNAINVKIIK
jgi:CspA family cold shock protein